MTSGSGLPPGPATPRFVQTFRWGMDPVALFDSYTKEYGGIFTLKVGFRSPVVCISEPDLIETLFRGEPSTFHAGEAYDVLGPVAGPQSLLLLDEDRHLRMRKMLLPPLHGSALAGWAELIEVKTREVVASWPAGRSFALRESMESITLDVIMRIVFGIRDPARSEELRQLLPSMFDVGYVLGAHFLDPRLQVDLGPLSPWGRFLRRRSRIDGLLFEEIRARRQELHERQGETDTERLDVLTLLLSARDDDGGGLTDRELRDSLISMLLAGHETTATSLAWAFERLVRHPDELERLGASVDAGETEYLDAVIKETLRTRPVVAQVGRVLARPTTIGDWTIPEGRMLMGLISAVHRNASLYPEPLAFRPQRFLDGEPGSYTWIPFGGGVRRCIGAGLAMLEMRTVIRTVLGMVSLLPSRPEDERPRARGITLAPARGGEVILTGRGSTRQSRPWTTP